MPTVLPHSGPRTTPPAPDTYVPQGKRRAFVADRFAVDVGEDWTDGTAYVLMGPFEHDLQHTLTIATDDTVGDEDLLAYAYPQIDAVLDTLRGCTLQTRGLARLDDGTPAYRVVFVWWPTDERRLYQEVWFCLHDGVGYRLTATFTRKTRRTLGPAVRRALKAFVPGPPAASDVPPSTPAYR